MGGRLLWEARDEPRQRRGHGERGDADVLQALADTLAQGAGQQFGRQGRAGKEAKFGPAARQRKAGRLAFAEGDVGTQLVYFLLQFTGVRSTPNEVLSVDYTTRDGSAHAGSDYIRAQGTLNLYPGEDQAVILVEILGDATPEPDETFYLDVINPAGGSFGEGVVKLTAVRTIVDDDGWLG